MKKTLIAAAVAAAVAAPAASAGVVIYGKIHVSIDYLDAELGGTPEGGYHVNSRSSRIGFKGSEDLGNGLKAIWKVENTVRITDTGTDDFSHDGKKGHWGSARNAYIGLAGDWGTFLYGRHDTPYKLALYATGIDMLGDSIIDVNSVYGITEVRADDAIAYVSPNWNGLTLAGAIIPGEGYTDSVTGEYFDSIADNYSISAMYSNNGLKLAVGYEVLDQGLPATAGAGTCATATNTAGDCDNTLIGAGYSINNFDVSGVYVMQDYGDVGNDIWVLAAAYTWGNNKFIANYGQSDLDGADKEDGYGLAVQHMFSKRTSAYLGYASSDIGPTTRGTANEGVSFGMIHNF
jgi:predicted porin